jgi:hypothetical protein
MDLDESFGKFLKKNWRLFLLLAVITTLAYYLVQEKITYDTKEWELYVWYSPECELLTMNIEEALKEKELENCTWVGYAERKVRVFKETQRLMEFNQRRLENEPNEEINEV